MSSEQDAVEQAVERLRRDIEYYVGRAIKEEDAPQTMLDARTLIDALEASQQEKRRIVERLQSIVNKHGWEVEAWGEDTLDIIEKKLEASQQENERLREFLNDIGYPDTAINVILDATEVVDALEEQEAQGD